LRQVVSIKSILTIASARPISELTQNAFSLRPGRAACDNDGAAIIETEGLGGNCSYDMLTTNLDEHKKTTCQHRAGGS